MRPCKNVACVRSYLRVCPFLRSRSETNLIFILSYALVPITTIERCFQNFNKLQFDPCAVKCWRRTIPEIKVETCLERREPYGAVLFVKQTNEDEKSGAMRERFRLLTRQVIPPSRVGHSGTTINVAVQLQLARNLNVVPVSTLVLKYTYLVSRGYILVKISHNRGWLRKVKKENEREGNSP